MGRLDGDMTSFNIGRGGFAFTGARFDKLAATATDFTLVTIAVDVSTSVGPFKNDLINMLKTSVDACKKNPRSENILVRVILFSARFDKGVSEIHGFKPLADINLDDYNSIKTGGWTPLIDACYSAVGATNKYAEEMRKQDFGSNAIFFDITDGDENASVATMEMLKNECKKALQSEALESLISILIGVNSDQYDAQRRATWRSLRNSFRNLFRASRRRSAPVVRASTSPQRYKKRHSTKGGASPPFLLIGRY